MAFAVTSGGFMKWNNYFEIADYNNIFVTNLLSCKRTQNVKKKKKGHRKFRLFLTLPTLLCDV